MKNETTQTEATMTTETYCDICDRDVETLWDVCPECWQESAAPGGVHADLTFMLGGVDGEEPITLGEFFAANPDLSGQECAELIRLSVGEWLRYGGGAGPAYSLTRING